MQLIRRHAGNTPDCWFEVCPGISIFDIAMKTRASYDFRISGGRAADCIEKSLDKAEHWFAVSLAGASFPFIRPAVLCWIILMSLSVVQLRSQEMVSASDTLASEAARLLSEYIQVSSVTGTEREAGEYISDKCREKGLHVEIFTDSIDCYNFAASLYPLELQKPNAVFLSHIDVVSGGTDSLWTYPPFSGAVVSDTVWGRGTIDMKGAAIMYLMATSSFVGRASMEDLPFNVTLLFVSGEETYGERGAEIICDYFMPSLNAVVMLGEGGIGTAELLSDEPDKPVFFISLSERRALWLELEVNYQASGHGAVPPSDYATRMMIHGLYDLTRREPEITFNNDNKGMLRAYGELEKGLKGFILRHPVFFRPLVASGLRKNPLMASAFTNTSTLTHLASEETAINQIPHRVKACLDCRLLPETETGRFLDNLAATLGHDEVSVRIVSETRNAPPTVPDHFYDIFTESLEEVYPGCGIVPFLFPATTDNNYFRNQGVPVYGIIPAVLDQRLMETIHTHNERLPVEALLKGTEVYRGFIDRLFMKSPEEEPLPETEAGDAPIDVSELQDIP